MGTRGQWGIDLAKALGNNNPDAKTVNFIAAWTKGENTYAKYNPLATTYDLPPNDCFNHVCVRNFRTRQQGIDATVRTLNGKYAGYEDIREGIRTNDANRAVDGLMRAPWGTNGSKVKQLWLNRDLRNEMLLSEPENEPNAPAPVNPPQNKPESPNRPPNQGVPISTVGTHSPNEPFMPDTAFPNPLGSEGSTNAGNYWGYDVGSAFDGTLTNNQRIVYFLAGGGLFVFAVWLAVRRFVPVQQVVETVAKAAL